MSSKKPYYFLNKDGKELEVVLSNTTYRGKWINKNLTLLFDMETNEFMGCEIYLGKDYEKVEKAMEEK
jgi:hypothetical protein